MTHWVDVLKTRLQAEKETTKGINVRNLSQRIWAQEGFRGFYKGYVSRMFGIGPMRATFWGTMDTVRIFLPTFPFEFSTGRMAKSREPQNAPARECERGKKLCRLRSRPSAIAFSQFPPRLLLCRFCSPEICGLSFSMLRDCLGNVGRVGVRSRCWDLNTHRPLR